MKKLYITPTTIIGFDRYLYCDKSSLIATTLGHCIHITACSLQPVNHHQGWHLAGGLAKHYCYLEPNMIVFSQ